ncbi:MAG: hypothetical protein GC168_03005 [Candidatus Hydrogenedens sp.]|nr:hypothetical protein [Candidatus Hydrogenedens sp.]
MLKWQKQGPAYTAPVQLSEGVSASAVVLGPASNPKALALVVAGADGQASIPFAEATDRLSMADLIQIYCMQERCFGNHGFRPPEGLGA